MVALFFRQPRVAGDVDEHHRRRYLGPGSHHAGGRQGTFGLLHEALEDRVFHEPVHQQVHDTQSDLTIFPARDRRGDDRLVLGHPSGDQGGDDGLVHEIALGRHESPTRVGDRADHAREVLATGPECRCPG